VRLTRRDPADPQQSRWGLLPSSAVSGGLASAVWQNGGTLTDVREAPTQMTVDQPPAVEAISWLTDLSVKHRVGPTAAERRALGSDPFVLGKVAMLWGGMALFFNTMFQVTDFTWDLVPGPRGPGGTPYLYYVDGRPDAQAFEGYLAGHPGAIALWLGGHTHTHPDDRTGGRSHVERKWGVSFVNCAALSRHHGRTNVPMSRLFTFVEGSAEARVQCYLHTSDYAPQGWYAPAERTVDLGRPVRLPARPAP
jgi:hypothetical protein